MGRRSATACEGSALMFGWFSKKSKMAKAVRKGDLSTVKAMLAEGFNPDQAYLFGNTLLKDAAYKGHLEVARALIAAGANVNVHSTTTALNQAAFHGHAEVVRLLLKSGADVNRADEMFRTPLMWAGWGGSQRR